MIAALILAVVLLIAVAVVLTRALRRLDRTAGFIADGAQFITGATETVVRAVEAITEEAKTPHCPLSPLPCPTCTPDNEGAR